MTDTDTQALVVQESRRLAPWTPRFALTVDEAVELVDKKREFMKRVMREGEHFGTIPGTPKPTLYKPGAELLLSAMGLHSDSSINTMPPVIDLLGTDHGGEAFVQFQKTCEIYREEIAGERILIARASANCSSWEKKYRYRKADLTCPTCAKVGTVIKSKAEYGGGWLCWKNKGGCGAKFTDTDKRITDQARGDVPNPDIADLANTVEKIASKRALVAATLLATGCSDIFTQDLEDGGGSGPSVDDERPPVVDQDGEIANPSQASVDALRTAQVAQGSPPAAIQPVPPSSGPTPAGTQAQAAKPERTESRSVGPRAKRQNVVTAPQAQPAPSVAPAAPVTTPRLLDDPLAPTPLHDEIAKMQAKVEELKAKARERDGKALNGEAEYLATLRQFTRESAGLLRQLRIRLQNLEGGKSTPLPEATPSADSDESLAVFINSQFPGKALDTLGVGELEKISKTLDDIITRVQVKLK